MSDPLLLDQVSDGSQLGAVRSAERLISNKVKILVGFPTSHEAMLAAKIAQKNGVLSIFSGASHSSLAEMGPSVFTTGESVGYSAEFTLSYIKRNYFGKRGILITNPYAVFAKNQEDTITKLLQKRQFQEVKLTKVHLNRDSLLDQSVLQALVSKNFDYIILTAYADESARLLDQFDRHQVDLPIVVNSSWTTADLEFVRRLLTKRKSPVITESIWLEGSPDSIAFERYYFKKYGKRPTSEVAYGYDLGLITAEVLNRIKGDVTKESILKSFQKNLCFKNLTSGRLCFDRNGGHAKRKLSFVRFTRDGFKPVNN